MKKKGMIYILINNKTKTPCYVGATFNTLESRLKEHHKNKIKKNTIIIGIENINNNNWEKREKYWIKIFSNQFNLLNKTIGGLGICGYKHTKKTKKIIKEKRAKQVFSLETRFKLSKKMIGNKKARGIHYKRNPNDLKKTWETRRKNGTDKGYHFIRNKKNI